MRKLIFLDFAFPYDRSSSLLEDHITYALHIIMIKT